MKRREYAKCPMCEGEITSHTQEVTTPYQDKRIGKQIVIKDILVYDCKGCGTSFLPWWEEERIVQDLEKAQYEEERDRVYEEEKMSEFAEEGKYGNEDEDERKGVEL